MLLSFNSFTLRYFYFIIKTEFLFNLYKLNILAIIPGKYRQIRDYKWVFFLHHRGVSTCIRCIFFIYLYHFNSLTSSIWSDAIFKIHSKSVKCLHFVHFIFFFWMKNRVHAASNKKIYSFSFKSLMKILYLFKPVLNVFQKKNCPIYYNHVRSLCKKCNFGGKGYILEFRAFGSKMKIKKNFTCTYIKRKQISTCTVKIWWFLGGYFDPYHTYIVLEKYFCTEIQKWNKWSGLHTSISTQS